jgi:hypothetical protein
MKEVYLLLAECSPTAQWVFIKITPLMEKGTPCGYLIRFENEISRDLRVSKGTISYAFRDLRSHGVLRKAPGNYWYCPGLIADMVRRALR